MAVVAGSDVAPDRKASVPIRWLYVRPMKSDDLGSSTPRLDGDLPIAASPRALADHAKLAEIAVERTRMPMVISDPRQPDNPIVLANKAFLDLTGYEAG